MQPSISGASAAPRRNGNPVEAVGMRPRKPARELDLVVREHVDRRSARRSRTRQGSRPGDQAPDDERRLERHRVERVRGEAGIAPSGRRARDDRHAGRELRQRIAKLPLGEGAGRGAPRGGGGRRTQEGRRGGGAGTKRRW